MEEWSDQSPRWEGLKIAATYAVLGIVWILFSDQLVSLLAGSDAQITLLQSVKGIGFIVFSAAVIYVLVANALRELTVTNAELEVALRQADRLHRILRHNLRNSCQVIAGNVEVLADRTGDEHEEFIEAIRTQNERLVSLSRKSIRLRGFLEVEPENVSTTDLVATVEEKARSARETYPGATIELDCPDEAQVRAHQYVGEAVEELVENAVIYNESAEPRVWLRVRRDGEHVTLTVADDGPGIPQIEQQVLERKTETQTEHSQGLGLWLVYLTVHYSGGTLAIEQSDHGGAAVHVTLPAA